MALAPFWSFGIAVPAAGPAVPGAGPTVSCASPASVSLGFCRRYEFHARLEILLLPAAAEKYLAEESVTAARDSIEGPPVSRREYQYGPEYVAAVSLIVARWRGGTTADVIDRTR